MGTDEQEGIKAADQGQSHLIVSGSDSKSPRSPQLAFDENRNDKRQGGQKTARFSFDKQISNSSSSNSSSPPDSARDHSPVPNRVKSKQPSWLTRKSADWGAATSGSRGTGAAGSRRTEHLIVLMGSSRVGKSAIVYQFLHNIFRQDHTPTVDELHWIEYDATNYVNQQDKKSESNGISTCTLLLKIMDTSGSHEFIGMRKLYEQQGDAFILVVGFDDPASFEEVKVIRQEIAERNNKKTPVICVLNKIDLKGEPLEKRVNVEDVRDFASKNQCLFVEATATDQESVSAIFKHLLQYNSIVPSAARLRYRRKSVPTATCNSDFAPNHVAVKKALSKKCLKTINETNCVNDDKPACIIS